jgi:hypothetical protein
MSPAASWILLLSLGFAIFSLMNALYIDSLKKEAEKNKPPF